MHVRNHELLDAKLKQYLVPAVMMKLALQLGNVVDAMLVGNLLGPEAMSAVSLASPALSLIQIPGYFLANGGAITAAILLGRRQKKEAKEVFTVTFLITLVFGLLFTISSFFLTQPMAHLFAKGGSLEPDVAKYVFVCLAGAPVLGLGLWLAFTLAGDSHPQLASAYFIVSNAVNLILDFVFLKYTSLGVTGAALSTMIGFGVGFVVAIFYVKSPRRMLSFVKPHIDKAIFRKVVSAGIPFLSYLIVAMIRALIMNTIVLSLLKEDGMAVFTVCNNTSLILAMLIGGVVGVIPNIASILYGEKDYYGIRSIFSKIIRYGLIITGVLMIVVFIFAKQFTLLFGVKDAQLQAVMISVLRVYVFAMPFDLWNSFGMQYYGSVEKSPMSTFITVCQNGVFLIPFAYLGISAGLKMGDYGFIGLGAAFVLSEAITVLASVIFRKIKYKGGSLLLIPKENPGESLDFTIKADADEVSSVPREIKAFCKEHNVDSSKSNLIAVCAEEMVLNTVQYGGSKSKWIDVCLMIDKNEDGTDKLMLMIRDNGVPFDPTTYKTGEDDFDIHGIELALKVAKDITYVRAIDLNNTTITV